MVSEFASHIGMRGKCFCRICHVRGGTDEKNRAPGLAGEIKRVEEFLKVCCVNMWLGQPDIGKIRLVNRG